MARKKVTWRNEWVEWKVTMKMIFCDKKVQQYDAEVGRGGG